MIADDCVFRRVDRNGSLNSLKTGDVGIIDYLWAKLQSSWRAVVPIITVFKAVIHDPHN